MGVGASDDRIGPADIDGYTNKSNSGAAGGGWGLTQQDAAGYEQWLAFTAHSDGLAVFQKNDGDNTATDEPYFDGMIIEECNHYDDPCRSGGDNTNLYIAAHKPVLNAEYTEDGESTAKFCSADDSAGISGALFNVDLDGKSYQICQTGAGYVYAAGGGVVTTTTSTTTPTEAKPVNTTHPGLSGTTKRGSQAPEMSASSSSRSSPQATRPDRRAQTSAASAVVIKKGRSSSFRMRSVRSRIG